MRARSWIRGPRVFSAKNVHGRVGRWGSSDGRVPGWKAISLPSTTWKADAIEKSLSPAQFVAAGEQAGSSGRPIGAFQENPEAGWSGRFAEQNPWVAWTSGTEYRISGTRPVGRESVPGGNGLPHRPCLARAPRPIPSVRCASSGVPDRRPRAAGGCPRLAMRGFEHRIASSCRRVRSSASCGFRPCRTR